MGPIMIGPSSSHTAGAARLGRMARKLLGRAPAKAELLLHGSFAATGSGHGTDRALAAGLLDDALQLVSDKRLNDRFPSAQRATLVSVSSMTFSLFMIPLSPLFGMFFS